MYGKNRSTDQDLFADYNSRERPPVLRFINSFSTNQHPRSTRQSVRFSAFLFSHRAGHLCRLALLSGLGVLAHMCAAGPALSKIVLFQSNMSNLEAAQLQTPGPAIEVLQNKTRTKNRRKGTWRYPRVFCTMSFFSIPPPITFCRALPQLAHTQ